MKNEEQERSLFGISLTDRPRWKQFLICSSGFFFGYLVNGICEVLSLFHCIYTLFGFWEGRWKEKKTKLGIPALSFFFLLSFVSDQPK